jgi:hypothetical protein
VTGGPCRMAGTAPHGWEMGRMDDITYVGLDVHKATLCVAVAEVPSRFVLEFVWRGLRLDEDTESGSKVNRLISEFLV